MSTQKSQKLKKLFEKQLLIGDGAMGTMIYQQGIFVNTCFDELNLTRPEMIGNIHQAYIDAGSDLIETNTFGANEFKLAKFGLADKVRQINTAAVEISKKAAGDHTLIAGSIGPLGIDLTDQTPENQKAAATAFAEQAKALADAGADLLILETFTSANQLLIAIEATAPTNLPIIAQLTVNEHHETPYGEKLQNAIPRIAAHPAVTVAGLNCSVGPADMLGALDILRQLTDKPISVQPNAGLPRQIDGRTLYMSTPEYMAEYAKRFYEHGARLIGGCCGSTPDHIRKIAAALRSLDKAALAHKPTPTQIPAIPAEKPKIQPQVQPTPLAEKSKLGAKLAAAQPVTTIEITPPHGIDLSKTIEKAELCADLEIDCINIPDGPRASSRLSPMVTALQIQQQANIETILHFCCRDRNLIGMQSDLLGASAVGLKNMLIITGDPPKCGDYPTATGVFDMDSVALTTVLKNLNAGIDIGANQFSPPTALTIGVGANPVASDLAREIDRFKLKVLAGAEYAITQPVFDPQMLLDFIEATGSHKIPIIAGIWPFTSYKNAEFMANEVPGVVVPTPLLDRMQKATTKEHARKLGIEIALEMMQKIEKYVAGFAVSAPFGNVKIALACHQKIDISEI